MSRETARYTRDGSSRAAGCVVYDDDTKIQVYSDTAPTRGQLNAFDLVRIEKFASLDKDVPPGTPMAQLPSYIKMCELARQQPELRSARAESELQELPAPEPANDDSWLGMPAPTPTARVRFQPYTAGELFARPRARWIVQGVLPQAEFALIVGEPGGGKTVLAWSMACAIQRGADWYGHQTVKGRVIYLPAEGQGGFIKRMRASDLEPHELPEVITDVPNMLEPKETAALAHAIGKADVLIVDTLSRVHQGNENSGEAMGLLLKHAQILHQHTGAIVVFIHHPPKNGDGARGWGGLFGAADTQITVTKQGDYRSADISKQKDGLEGPLLNFKIVGRETGLQDDWGNPETAAVMEVVNAPIVKASKLPKPGTEIRITFDAVVAAIRQNGGALELEKVQQAAVDSMPEPLPGESDRRVQRTNEYIKKLEARDLLFRVNGKLSDTQLIKGGDDAGF